MGVHARGDGVGDAHTDEMELFVLRGLRHDACWMASLEGGLRNCTLSLGVVLCIDDGNRLKSLRSGYTHTHVACSAAQQLDGSQVARYAWSKLGVLRILFQISGS